MPTEALTPRHSDAIAAARVICIMGIVYVHAWTGATGEILAQQAQSGQSILRWAMMEGLGRSAVPLLGLISGWLVAGSALRRGYGAFVAGKARAILLPMLAWNAIAILVIWAAVRAFGLQAPTPHSLEWVAQEMFSLTRANDINVQMGFLRDLFLCMLAAPMLVRLPRWALALCIVLTAAWVVSQWFFPLLLRPQIALFFLIGIAGRRAMLGERVAGWPVAPIVVPFVLLAALRMWLPIWGMDWMVAQPQMAAGAELALRLCAAALFWRIAWALAAGRAMPLLRRIEPFMFLMFCCHLILIWLAGPAIGRLTGSIGSPLWPAYFLVQPLLALGGAGLLGRMLLAIHPATAAILSGGRLRRAPNRGGKASRPAPLSSPLTS